MIDHTQMTYHDYATRAVLYLESSQSQHTSTPKRPPFVPSRIRLPEPVHGDWPIGHTIVAEAGDYDCETNQWGAVFITVCGSTLGVKPDEFVILEWMENPKAIRDTMDRETANE